MICGYFRDQIHLKDPNFVIPEPALSTMWRLMGLRMLSLRLLPVGFVRSFQATAAREDRVLRRTLHRVERREHFVLGEIYLSLTHAQNSQRCWQSFSDCHWSFGTGQCSNPWLHHIIHPNFESWNSIIVHHKALSLEKLNAPLHWLLYSSLSHAFPVIIWVKSLIYDGQPRLWSKHS